MELASHTFYLKRGKGGPSVAIMGSVHGNEKLGVEILEKLNREMKSENIHGEVYLITGNPKAYQAGTRFVDCDLNRLFGADFERLAKKSEKKLHYEEKRALEIAPILQGVDYLLDIHSTTKPSVPFVFADSTLQHLRIASIFGTQYVVSPSIYFQPPTPCLVSSADNFVDKHGGIGLTYETGWYKDSNGFDEVFTNVKRFLSMVGVAFLGTLVKPLKRSFDHLLIYDAIKPETSEFIFLKDYANFDYVRIGEKIADDGGLPVTVHRDSFIIFPKTDISVGRVACYLAHVSNPCG